MKCWLFNYRNIPSKTNFLIKKLFTAPTRKAVSRKIKEYKINTIVKSIGSSLSSKSRKMSTQMYSFCVNN